MVQETLSGGAGGDQNRPPANRLAAFPRGHEGMAPGHQSIDR